MILIVTYETVTGSFIPDAWQLRSLYKKGDDVRVNTDTTPIFCALLVATIQSHLRRDPVLLKIFRNKSWRFSEWSSYGDRKHYAKKSCIP